MPNRKDTDKSDGHSQSNPQTHKNTQVNERALETNRHHPVRDTRPPPSSPEDSDKPSGTDND